VTLSSINREVEVRGRRISLNHVDVGESSTDPAIVLVHGLGGRWQHWLRVIPAISAHQRVIALDLPGFGESPPLGERIDIAGLADAVAGLLGDLGIQRVVFVGHSFGGPLATTFAARHKALTARLVLVAGTVQSFQRTLAGRLGPWLTRPRTAAATIAELLYAAAPVPDRLRLALAASPALRTLALWPFVWKPARLSPEDAKLLLEGAGAAGVLPTARAIAACSGWERLHVDAPVALINGDHDLIAPLADLRAYPGRVDQVFVVKGTGHLPMLEAPESFVAAFNGALVAPSSAL
jgi:pimeloyl-ACP methyl ester carboxylesterase